MLKDKIALVTGSTSGIGLGIATGLAARGCQLVLNGFGDAAGSITGTSIAIDGGWTAH